MKIDFFIYVLRVRDFTTTFARPKDSTSSFHLSIYQERFFTALSCPSHMYHHRVLSRVLYGLSTSLGSVKHA